MLYFYSLFIPCLYNPWILFEFIFSGFLTLNPKIILSRYLQYNITETGIFKRQCELNLAYLKRSTDVLPNVFHYTNWFIYWKYFSLKKNWNHSQFYFQNAPLKFSTSLVCFWLLLKNHWIFVFPLRSQAYWNSLQSDSTSYMK